MPFFFIAGLRRKKGLVGRDIFRYLGALLLMVSVAQFTGCAGGGFQPPAQPATGSGTPPGNYLVNVVAMGSDGNKYQASVPLVVSQ